MIFPSTIFSAVSVVRRNPIWLKALLLTAYPAGSTRNKPCCKKRRVWVSPNECLTKQRKLCVCDLLRKAVCGIGNYPKKKRAATCKVATLQRCGTFAILQCSFSAGMPIRSLGGVQGALFKGRPCWGRQPQLPGAKPPHHPVGRKCAFDGRQAVKSAFALLSQKVTKARRLRGGKGRRD